LFHKASRGNKPSHCSSKQPTNGTRIGPAVRSFARTFTTDLKDRKIRVNAISPGVIPSPGYRNSLGMTEEQVKQYADSVVGNIPLGRTGTLDEIAKVVSFLASDESSYITGIELVVDGGMTQI
jgi:NAD(P)-dependent dehydrogenase (short-subunit alcohol dehydrogenase family)